MDPALVFTVCNNAILPAWLLLAAAPTWRWTQRIVHGAWIPGLLALVEKFHAHEGIEMIDAVRQRAVETLLGDHTLGRIWLIEVDGELAGYLAIYKELGLPEPR